MATIFWSKKHSVHRAAESGDVEEVRRLLQEGKYDVDNCTPFKPEWNPLHCACAKGHLAVVRALVSEYKADLTILDCYGRSILMLAAKSGDNDLVVALLNDYHCPLTDKDEDGWGVLHHACAGGNYSIVQRLINDHNANVNQETNDKDTPLLVAAKHGHFKIVFGLINDYGCDPVSRVDSKGQTLLHYACKAGSLDGVHALIERFNADAEAQDFNMKTPLCLAIENSNLEVVQYLVKKFGCDPTALYNGLPLLHHACQWGALDLVLTLVQDYKADASAQNHFNETALEVAALADNYEIAVALVKYGCDPNQVVMKYNGNTLLHLLCLSGATLELIHALIKDHKADLHALNNNKETPLHIAALAGHYDIALALVNHGCDPNQAMDDHGRTLLHLGCEKGAIDFVRTLVLEHKANISVLSASKETPLQVAAKAGNFEVALNLISYGCDQNTIFSNGQTLLHLACESGALCAVSALIQEYEADTRILNNNMKTPLQVAVKSGYFEIAIALIKYGSDPNQVVDHSGQTLLHLACHDGSVDHVQALVKEHKADVNARNQYEDTPLHVAARAGQSEVVLTLIDSGCDPSVRGYLGRTPLHVASMNGKDNVVQALLKYTSPFLTDKKGNTALHFAAEKNSMECIQLLLKANAPLLIRNNLGDMCSDKARDECKAFLKTYISKNKHNLDINYKKIFDYAKKRYSGAHTITRVFVLGNPGGGKSSFIAALKREGFLNSFSKVSGSSVHLHTAGIIPSVHQSKEYGRLLFYDFAGNAEYYSSHAAIFESLASSKKGDNIFVIVVDLREDGAVIEATLHYWFSFIEYQKFSQPLLAVVGSHLDQAPKHKEKGKVLTRFCEAVDSKVRCSESFKINCRDPRSTQMTDFKKKITSWFSGSPKYKISDEATRLLGLLEQDFNAVSACPIHTLASHIKDSGVCLPLEPEGLNRIILELHEVGVLLLLGDCTKDSDHIILNVSKLTIEVHELLFSESAVSNIIEKFPELKLTSFKIGILPEDILQKILPPHVTKECLIHLQYCQEIGSGEVNVFSSIEQTDSPNQSFLFFPALCSVDKSQVPWNESSAKDFSISWLALCTNLHDYFPSRFLHVLLLRLVYGFTLSVPTQLHASKYNHRCTMWKKGVYWKKDGVDCMVELVNGSKGVVVHSKSSSDRAETCVGVFVKVVSLVMEAKAEFCHSIKPQFFLLDSSAEADYLNEDHQFALSDVEEALALHRSMGGDEKAVITSVSGKGEVELSLSKLQYMRKLTHWDAIFPFEFQEVLHILRVIVVKLYDFGFLHLGAPEAFLEKLKVNYPFDVDQRRIELVRWWMRSSQDPCWWTLAEALEDFEQSTLADNIRKEHSLHIQLQEKLLSQKNKDKTPENDFLIPFSSVLGSKWLSLAVFLELSEEEIEKFKEKTEFSQEERALQMLKIWASREDATYGYLYNKLKTISLFQYSS